MLTVLTCALLPACHDDRASGDASADGEIVDPLDAPVDAPDLDALAAEQRALQLGAARAAFDGGTYDGGEVYAAAVRTSVVSSPGWPEGDAGAGSTRLGYLRHGSHVPAFAERIVNDACVEGWYELIEGGFVCGKYVSTDANNPAVKFAANPPNLDAAMPYRYGYAVASDTPVYKRVLSLVDRRKFEPWLAPPVASVTASAVASASSGPVGIPSVSEESDNPYEDTAAEPRGKRGRDAGAKAVKDAGPPKLGDLRGRGVLARKMMRGFYVAIDRDFRAANARWWRTAEGFAIPYERLALQSWAPEFHGGWVKRFDPQTSDAGGDAPEGNGTAVLVNSTYAVRYALDDKGKMKWTAPLPKVTALELSGEPRTEGGIAYQLTTSGFYVRLGDLLVAAPQVPDDVGPNEKWIDVDLGRQLLVAFEGKHPVYGTRVSSGRRTPWDPEHDHPTPTGTFRIYEKHVSTTMDGDVASDGPYSIEDVPWVMYFQGSYALHGAFWHNGFGSPRSHGCVNLSPIDARELFFWTEPRLPKGWHGVYASGAQPGTRVVIHEPPAVPPAPK